MTLTRRAVLTLSAVAAAGTAAGVAAGCSRATQRSSAPPAAPPGGSVSTPDSPAATAATSPTAADTSTARSGRAGGPAVEYTHGPRTRAEVALTFHGAGDPRIATDLLSIFAAHRAAVTVLAVGSWLESNPQLAHDILAGGHELGNHTYTHPDIDSLGAAAADGEIVRCRDVLHRLTGSGGAHFRPSQTQHASPLVLRLAGAAGYPVCLSYDVDSLDWTDPGPAAVRRTVATAAAGSIVSMHFGHSGTVAAMPAVLGDLAARGLSPVTATRLLRP